MCPRSPKLCPLTLNVVLGVRLTRLVVVNHGDDVQKIVLAKLLQAIRQLLHVYVLVLSALLLDCILVTHTICLGGTRLCKKCKQLRLGIPEGLSGSSQPFVHGGRLHWLCTYHLVLGLVALRLKVEVMVECVVAAFAHSGQDDGHLELTPALLVDTERGLLDDCVAISKSACRSIRHGTLTMLVLLE